MAELKVEHADPIIPKVKLHTEEVLEGDPAILFALLAENYPWGRAGISKICITRAFFPDKSLKDKDLPVLVESLKRSLPKELVISEGVNRGRSTLSLFINPNIKSFYHDSSWRLIPDSEPIKIVDAETEEEKSEKLAIEALARVAYFFDPEALKSVHLGKYSLRTLPENIDRVIKNPSKSGFKIGRLKFELDSSGQLVCWSETKSQRLVEAALALYLGEKIRRNREVMEIPDHNKQLDLVTFRHAFRITDDLLKHYTPSHFHQHPNAGPLRIGNLTKAMLLDLRGKLPRPEVTQKAVSDLPLAAAS